MSSTVAATKGYRGKSKNTKLAFRSSKVDLQFPISQVVHFLKKGRYTQLVSFGFRFYLSIILKYLATEVLELARNVTRDNKRNRIVLRHIQLAMRNDEELSKFLGFMMIANGGISPNILHNLLPKKEAGTK